MRILAILVILAGCAAPERLARSLELSAWTYDSDDSGSAHRVAASGEVGSGGIVSSSGEGYGFGVTMSLDRLLGPEVQPVRWEAPPATADWGRAWEAPAKPAGKPKRGRPSAWYLTLLPPLAAGVYEALSRRGGGEGFVVPCARKLVAKFRPSGS